MRLFEHQGFEQLLLAAEPGSSRDEKIHVGCDNARCHLSEAVMIYLWEHRDRIKVHLLPAYCPRTPT